MVFQVRKAQSLVNYGILFVTISLALFGMVKYLKRGIQGKVAGLSDAMIAPQSDHLAYTDNTMNYDATYSQSANSQTILSDGGAQSTVSTVTATSNSYTETEDPDYVPGDGPD
jgi:Flp pilus assembly pilin Flp